MDQLFIQLFMPDYAVISVGNKKGLPNENTLTQLQQADAKVYRTDRDGDIFVKSDGESISVSTSK